jgi:hypothetical protein
MKKIFFFLLVVFMLSLSLTMPGMARAQVPASVVDTTTYVPASIRSAVDAWLAVSPPTALPYYAITYFDPRGLDTFVSLAALNIPTPSAAWHVTEDAAWLGSVLIHADQSVTMISMPRASMGIKAFAIPYLAPGGGADIRFPWQNGEKMMYGEAGVHAAGGGGAYAEGFLAVDFLGGSDLGSGVAHDMVYAAFDGTVDYVCADDTTTLIRTTDEASDNRFIYAHLLDNANLVENHVFTKGTGIGSLKHGTFDDDCGWADQTDLHYHLHFGFEAANNAFRMEDCILDIDTEKWTCGTDTVSPGEYLLNVDAGGGIGGGVSVDNPSFWDMVLVGFSGLWTSLVVDNLPEHKALEYTYVLYNTVILMLKIAWVMVYSNINLGHLVVVLFVGLVIKAIFGIAEFLMFLLKAWKSLIPIIGA